MIGYVTIGVSDMEKAKAFYTELLKDLGGKLLLDMGRIAFIGENMKSPMLAVCTPFNGEAPNPGNGNMVSIPAGSKEAVDAYYQKAIGLGATSEGEASRASVFPGSFMGPMLEIQMATSWPFSTSGNCFGSL